MGLVKQISFNEHRSWGREREDRRERGREGERERILVQNMKVHQVLSSDLCFLEREREREREGERERENFSAQDEGTPDTQPKSRGISEGQGKVFYIKYQYLLFEQWQSLIKRQYCEPDPT